MTLIGLDPARDKPSLFLVNRLNHSVTVSYGIPTPLNNVAHAPMTGNVGFYYQTTGTRQIVLPWNLRRSLCRWTAVRPVLTEVADQEQFCLFVCLFVCLKKTGFRFRKMGVHCSSMKSRMVASGRSWTHEYHYTQIWVKPSVWAQMHAIVMQLGEHFKSNSPA